MKVFGFVIFLAFISVSSFAAENEKSKKVYFDLDLGSGIVSTSGSAQDLKKTFESKGFSGDSPINSNLGVYLPLSEESLLGAKISYTHISLSQMDDRKNKISFDVSSAAAYYQYHISGVKRGFYIGAGVGGSFAVNLMPDSSNFLGVPKCGLAIPKEIGYKVPLSGMFSFNIVLHSETNWISGGAVQTDTLNVGLSF